MRPSIVTGPHGLDEMLFAFAVCSNADTHYLTEYCSRLHESRTYIDGYMFLVD